MFAALVAARELLRQSNEQFVVYVERYGFELWEAQVLDNGPEVKNVFSCFYCCMVSSSVELIVTIVCLLLRT